MSVEAAVVAKRIRCSARSVEIYTRTRGLPCRLWYGGGPGRPKRVYVMEEVEAWLAAGKKPKLGRKRKSREVGVGSGERAKSEKRTVNKVSPTLPSRCAGAPLCSSGIPLCGPSVSSVYRSPASRATQAVKKKRSWYLHNPEVEARARKATAERRARKAEEERVEREGRHIGIRGAPSAVGTSPGGGGGRAEGEGDGSTGGETVCRRCGDEKPAGLRWWCDACVGVAGRLQKRGMTMVQIAASGECDAEPDGGEHGMGWRGIRSDVVIGERYWQPRDD